MTSASGGELVLLMSSTNPRWPAMTGEERIAEIDERLGRPLDAEARSLLEAERRRLADQVPR